MLRAIGALRQDAADNKALLAKGKITMPVLHRAEKFFGKNMPSYQFRGTSRAASCPTPAWIMEENHRAPSSWLDFLAKTKRRRKDNN